MRCRHHISRKLERDQKLSHFCDRGLVRSIRKEKSGSRQDQNKRQGDSSPLDFTGHPLESLDRLTCSEGLSGFYQAVGVGPVVADIGHLGLIYMICPQPWLSITVEAVLCPLSAQSARRVHSATGNQDSLSSSTQRSLYRQHVDPPNARNRHDPIAGQVIAATISVCFEAFSGGFRTYERHVARIFLQIRYKLAHIQNWQCQLRYRGRITGSNTYSTSNTFGNVDKGHLPGVCAALLIGHHLDRIERAILKTLGTSVAAGLIYLCSLWLFLRQPPRNTPEPDRTEEQKQPEHPTTQPFGKEQRHHEQPVYLQILRHY